MKELEVEQLQELQRALQEIKSKVDTANMVLVNTTTTTDLVDRIQVEGILTGLVPHTRVCRRYMQGQVTEICAAIRTARAWVAEGRPSDRVVQLLRSIDPIVMLRLRSVEAILATNPDDLEEIELEEVHEDPSPPPRPHSAWERLLAAATHRTPASAP